MIKLPKEVVTDSRRGNQCQQMHGMRALLCALSASSIFNHDQFLSEITVDRSRGDGSFTPTIFHVTAVPNTIKSHHPRDTESKNAFKNHVLSPTDWQTAGSWRWSH